MSKSHKKPILIFVVALVFAVAIVLTVKANIGKTPQEAIETTESVDYSVITEGMTQSDVVTEVGDPQDIHYSKEEDFNSEMWFYSGMTIVFVDGKVQMTSYY